MDEEARLEDLPYHLRWMVRRRAARIAQKDLARALDLAPTALSAYENSRRLPPDPEAFDRRHREAVEQFPAPQLMLQDVPPTVGDQFEQLINELAQLIRVPLRVTRHHTGEDRASYVVEIPKHGAPLGAPTRKRGKKSETTSDPGTATRDTGTER